MRPSSVPPRRSAGSGSSPRPRRHGSRRLALGIVNDAYQERSAGRRSALALLEAEIRLFDAPGRTPRSLARVLATAETDAPLLEISAHAAHVALLLREPAGLGHADLGDGSFAPPPTVGLVAALLTAHEGDELDAIFAAALERHNAAGDDFQRAWRERLRRGKQKAAAREQLRSALAVFEELATQAGRSGSARSRG